MTDSIDTLVWLRLRREGLSDDADRVGIHDLQKNLLKDARGKQTLRTEQSERNSLRNITYYGVRPRHVGGMQSLASSTRQ